MSECDDSAGFMPLGTARLGRRCVPDTAAHEGIGADVDRAFRALEEDEAPVCCGSAERGH